MNTVTINSSSITSNLIRKFPEKIKADPYLLVIPLLTIAVRLIIFLFIPFTYEDAFITFRYAENLASGSGLVYNLGENVYGTTTPLYAILLSGFYVLGVSCIVSSLAINLIAESITSLVVYKILKDYSNGSVSAIVSLLYVFSPSNISWSIQGMETAFFSALIAISFYQLYKNNYFYAVSFAILSAMTRVDGLSIAAVVCAFTLYKLRFSAFRVFFLPWTVFIAWLLFLYLYFGSILPNSMLAKLILYSGHNPSLLPGLKLVLSKFFVVGYYSSSIISVLFLIGIFQAYKYKRALLPMIAWFFIYFSALVMSKTVIHGWYLIPPLFVFTTVSGIGIVFMFNKVLGLVKLNERIFKRLLFIMILMFSSLMLFLKLKQIYSEYQYEQSVRVPIGLFLNNHTPANSTVFLEPIGVIGYYSKRYIYDDAALVSPVFLEINRLPYNAESQYKKIDLVEPDYLVIRDRDLEEFYAKTDLTKDYKALKNFVYLPNPSDSSFLSMTIFERNK